MPSVKAKDLRIGVLVVGCLSLAIALWGLYMYIFSGFITTDSLTTYTRYIDSPILLFSSFAAVLCFVMFWLHSKFHNDTRLFVFIIILSLLTVSAGFVVRYNRTGPVRFAQATLADIHAPVQFTDKQIVTLPGDFNTPTAQWTTSLPESEVCQALSTIIANWERAMNASQAVNVSKNHGSAPDCDYMGSIRGVSLDASTFVNTAACATDQKTTKVTCVSVKNQPIYLLVTLTANLPASVLQN